MFFKTGFILFFTLLALVAQSATADYEGFVELNKDRQLFVKFRRAEPGQPTLVLLNGLTYSTKQWQNFTDQLATQAPGFGILRYDMWGQGQTLFKFGPAIYDIPVEQQASDLHLLLDRLELSSDVHLVGLSYGGAVAMLYDATFPGVVTSVIAMAPYVAPLESQDNWIRSQIWLTRQVQPGNRASDDELYDFFLRNIVYTTYPIVEPVILENPFSLEAVFRMAKGIRRLYVSDFINQMGTGKLHLMVASDDEYVSSQTYEELWQAAPKSIKGSRLKLTQTKHKIPENTPRYAAAWVVQIARKDPRISAGRSFTGLPASGIAKSDDQEEEVIELRKE